MISAHWIRKNSRRTLNVLKERGLVSAFRFVVVSLLEDAQWLGRFVELRGNTGKLDGCTFDLDQAVITTYLKSRFLLNSWEEEARHLFRKYRPVDLPLIELGASIGIISCITNKQLTDPESHIVIEANPRLLPALEKNRADNHCRFSVLNKAVAYGTAEVHFDINERCNEGCLSSATEGIVVPATTLREILDTCGFDRANMICDIEGAEIALVENDGHLLRDHIDWMIVEVHGKEGPRQTRLMMEQLQFRLIEEFDNNQIYRNTRWLPSSESNRGNDE